MSSTRYSPSKALELKKDKSESRATGRRTNLALLVLLPFAVLSGLVANTAGTTWGIHPSVLHGMTALAILILAPWKQAIVRRGLRKKRKSSWVSIALLVLVLSTLTTGVMHATGYTERIGPLTLMQVHIGGALLALLLAWFHYRSHPVRLNQSIDLNRRTFLRTTGLATSAGMGWLGWEATLDALRLSGGQRRFTGSHEKGSFNPGQLPVTSWLDDRVQSVEARTWTLNVDGVSLRLSDIEALSHDDFEATLDCTSAWFSTQFWSGVRLDRIVDVGGHRSIAVKSRTGYSRRFPARDIEKLWLVTRLGGEPLSAGHGYPARIVAPDRRGFWWVKWVVAIYPSDVPWWVQLPFPAT